MATYYAASCEYAAVAAAIALADSGDTVIVPSGSATWEEYYTPYTYPHPLRAEGEGQGEGGYLIWTH